MVDMTTPLHRTIVALSATLVIGIPAAAEPSSIPSDTDNAPFHTVKLDNGLTVLMVPSHAHPVIALSSFVTTGGRTEDEYYQGSLHYIEHLVFKGGTPNLEPTEFRKTMSLLGGENGGWTWDDEINFGFETPKENFVEALGVFREALLDLEFEEEWFEDEKRVVRQEMEKGFERPGNILYNVWDTLAFDVHAYGRPVIGSEKAVMELDMVKTEQYYRERFTPNHMVLSVVGDFEIEQMTEWIEDEWGDLEPGPESFDLGLVEPDQAGARWREEFIPQATNASLLVGVRTPGGADRDAPALEILSALLNNTTFGLPQFLEEQEKWVTSVGAGTYLMRDHGTVRIYARCEPEKMDAVREFATEFLLNFDATTIPESVFEETRRALIAAEERQRATYADRSERLGFLTSRMGLDGAAGYLDALSRVTLSEVQAAKARCVSPKKLVTVTVYPQDFDPRAAAASNARVTPREPELVDVPNLDVEGGLRVPSGQVALVYETIESVNGVSVYEFENGLQLVVRPSDATELLAVSGRVLGGQWVEPEGSEGINRFVSELGMRATRRWGREAFARLLDARALRASAHISVGSRANTSRHQDHRDAAAHHLVGLSDQWPEVLAILKETLFFPAFDAYEIDKLRDDLIDEASRLVENNLEYIKQSFYNRAFAGHPYGRPTGGTEESLRALLPAELSAFHEENWTPDRVVISVVGNVDAEDVARWLAAHWSDVPGRVGGDVPVSAPSSWSPPSDIQVLDLGKDQWTVNWGRPGVGMGDPAYYPSMVLGSMAGNDHFYKYVYEQGVSYRSWIRFWEGHGAGVWLIENDVQRDRFDQVLEDFVADIERYGSDGFRRKEFDDTIQRLVNSRVLGQQHNARLAWRLAVAQGNGIGVSHVTDAVGHIRSVTFDRVRELARDVFQPEALYRLVQK